MKKYIFILFILFVIFSIIVLGCKTAIPNFENTKKQVATSKNDTVKIANKNLDYEVIIIEPGFDTWLNSTAFPRHYYSQSYLENKNRIYVSEWNNRASQPLKYNPNLYEMCINYEPNIDYGYEVNYLIYNYMIYFQNTYKQKLN